MVELTAAYALGLSTLLVYAVKICLKVRGVWKQYR